MSNLFSDRIGRIIEFCRQTVVITRSLTDHFGLAGRLKCSTNEYKIPTTTTVWIDKSLREIESWSPAARDEVKFRSEDQTVIMSLLVSQSISSGSVKSQSSFTSRLFCPCGDSVVTYCVEQS